MVWKTLRLKNTNLVTHWADKTQSESTHSLVNGSKLRPPTVSVNTRFIMEHFTDNVCFAAPWGGWYHWQEQKSSNWNGEKNEQEQMDPRFHCYSPNSCYHSHHLLQAGQLVVSTFIHMVHFVPLGGQLMMGLTFSPLYICMLCLESTVT